MKKILLILIFIFIQSPFLFAEDYKELEIEGMSIDDSLLNFFSKEEVIKSKVDWYDDLEKNRYVAIALESKNFEEYDFVDIFTKYGDKDYKIETIAGVIYFGNDKKIKNIDDCYKKQTIIADEIQSTITSSKRRGPFTLVHNLDPTGKSSYTDIYLSLSGDYEVVIACYDWADHLETKPDHMYIGIRSNELSLWLD